MGKTKKGSNVGGKVGYTNKFDLSSLRGKYDDIKAIVVALPEGKERTAIMNKLEESYLWNANAFEKLVATPTPA